MVEDINKKREPLPTMEGIYLMTPTEESIRYLMRDFESPNRPLYKGAHVFFTEGESLTHTNLFFYWMILNLYGFNWQFYYFYLENIFLAAIPDHLFELLKGSKVLKYMKTCREINIEFIPYEAQVFNCFFKPLNCHRVLINWFGSCLVYSSLTHL